MPVESVIVPLRREAERRNAYTGEAVFAGADGTANLTFRYRVLRVWEESAESFLAAGRGALPLAPLASVSKANLPAVMNRLEARLRVETSKSEAATLRVITGVLMGLRFDGAIDSVL